MAAAESKPLAVSPHCWQPLVAFFVIAYGLSWAYWIPLALAGIRVAPGSRATHFPGLFGPALSAFAVAGFMNGPASIAALARRTVLVSRPVGRFALYAFSPLIFLAIAIAVAPAIGETVPPLADFAIYSGLPPIGLPFVVLLVVAGGFGEEIGWRGFALEPLQHRFGSLFGALILGVLWAGWHAPLFFIVETYRAMTMPMIVGGFGLGICAGALVLARIARRTGGSVLAAALWHSMYNLTSATAASRGVIAAVTTSAVILWAIVVVIDEARSRRA